MMEVDSASPSSFASGLSRQDVLLCLCARFKANDTTLRSLDVAGFDLSLPSSSSSPSSPSHQPLEGGGAQVVAEIRALLQAGAVYNTLVHSISFRNCNLDDQFVIDFFRSLQRVAKSSRRRQFLRSIDLRGNFRLSEAIVLPILDCLLCHDTLCEIKLHDDNDSADDEEKKPNNHISLSSLKLCFDFCALQQFPAAVKQLAWDVWSSPGAGPFKRIKTSSTKDSGGRNTDDDDHPNIQFAVLNRNDTDPRGYTSAAVDSIVSLLEQAPDTLRTLRFERDCVRGDHSAERLAAYFRGVPSLSLRELNVRNNGWTTRGLKCVLGAMAALHARQQSLLDCTEDEGLRRRQVELEERSERDDDAVGFRNVTAEIVQQQVETKRHLQQEVADTKKSVSHRAVLQQLGELCEEDDDVDGAARDHAAQPAAATRKERSPSPVATSSVPGTCHSSMSSTPSELSKSDRNASAASTTTTLSSRLRYSNLTVLDLGNNDIDDDGVRYLAQLAQTTLVHLTRVALDGNPRVTPAAAAELFRTCSINAEGGTLRPALAALDDVNLTRFTLRGGDPGVDPMSNVGFRSLLGKMIGNNLSHLRELVICNHNFGVEAVRHLARFIKGHGNLVRVDLSNNAAVDDECIHHVVRALYVNNSVVSVNIGGCNVTQRVAAQLREACALNREPGPLKHYVQLPAADPTFAKMSLRCAHAGQQQARAAALVASIAVNNHNDNNSNNKNNADFAKEKKQQLDAESFRWIIQVLQMQPQVWELDLSGNDLDDASFARLLELLRLGLPFSKLNIASTGMTNQRAAVLANVLYLNHSVNVIVATGNPKLYPDGHQTLVTATTMNQLPAQFKVLYRYLVGGVEGITQVCFNGSSPGIGNEGAKILLSALAGTSQQQQVGIGNSVAALGTQQSLMLAGGRSLPSLTFNNNNNNSNTYYSSSSPLPQSRPLRVTSLVLTYQQLTDEISVELQTCLARQRTLRHLSLAHNSLGDNAAYAIAAVISGQRENGAARCLESVDLSHNLIGDVGVFELIRGVHQLLFAPLPYPLQSVDVSGNNSISDLPAAIQAMQLRLEWCKQPREFQVAFARALPPMLRTTLTNRTRLMREQARRERQERYAEQQQQRAAEERQHSVASSRGTPAADDEHLLQHDHGSNHHLLEGGGGGGGGAGRHGMIETCSSAGNSSTASALSLHDAADELASNTSGGHRTPGSRSLDGSFALGSVADETSSNFSHDPHSHQHPSNSSNDNNKNSSIHNNPNEQQEGRASKYIFSWTEREMVFVGSDAVHLDEQSFPLLLGCMQEQKIHYRGQQSKIRTVRFPRHNLSTSQLRGLCSLLQLLDNCRTLDLGGCAFYLSKTKEQQQHQQRDHVDNTSNNKGSDNDPSVGGTVSAEGILSLSSAAVHAKTTTAGALEAAKVLTDIAVACPHVHHMNLRAEDDLHDSDEDELAATTAAAAAAAAAATAACFDGNETTTTATPAPKRQHQKEQNPSESFLIVPSVRVDAATTTAGAREKKASDKNNNNNNYNNTSDQNHRVAGKRKKSASIADTKPDEMSRSNDDDDGGGGDAASADMDDLSDDDGDDSENDDEESNAQQLLRLKSPGSAAVLSAGRNMNNNNNNNNNDDDDDGSIAAENARRLEEKRTRKERRRFQRRERRKQHMQFADDKKMKKMHSDKMAEEEGDDEEKELARQKRAVEAAQAAAEETALQEQLLVAYERLNSVLRANSLLPPSARQIWIRATLARWQHQDAVAAAERRVREEHRQQQVRQQQRFQQQQQQQQQQTAGSRPTVARAMLLAAATTTTRTTATPSVHVVSAPSSSSLLPDHPLNWRQLVVGSNNGVTSSLSSPATATAAAAAVATAAASPAAAEREKEDPSCEAMWYLLMSISPVNFSWQEIAKFAELDAERRRLRAERQRQKEELEAAEHAAMAAAAKAAETGQQLPPDVAALAAAAMVRRGSFVASAENLFLPVNNNIVATSSMSPLSSLSLSVAAYPSAVAASPSPDDGSLRGSPSPILLPSPSSIRIRNQQLQQQQHMTMTRRDKRELQRKQKAEEADRKKKLAFEASVPTQEDFTAKLLKRYHDHVLVEEEEEAAAGSNINQQQQQPQPQHLKHPPLRQLKKLHVVDLSRLKRLRDDVAVLVCIWIRCVAPHAVNHIAVPFLSNAVQREAVSLLVESDEGRNIRRFSMQLEDFKCEDHQPAQTAATSAQSLLHGKGHIETLEEFALLKKIHQTCERNRRGLHHHTAAGPAASSTRFKSVRDYVLRAQQQQQQHQQQEQQPTTMLRARNAMTTGDLSMGSASIAEQISMLRTENDDIDADADSGVSDWLAGKLQAAMEAAEQASAEAATSSTAAAKSQLRPTSASVLCGTQAAAVALKLATVSCSSSTPAPYVRRHRPGDEILAWSQRKKAAAELREAEEAQERRHNAVAEEEQRLAEERARRGGNAAASAVVSPALGDLYQQRRGTVVPPLFSTYADSVGRKRSIDDSFFAGAFTLDGEGGGNNNNNNNNNNAEDEDAPRATGAAALASRLRKELQELELEAQA